MFSSPVLFGMMECTIAIFTGHHISLKNLRLISCDMHTRAFAEGVNKFPLLEELHLENCSYLGCDGPYEIVSKACPHLKSFKLINYSLDEDDDPGDPYLEYPYLHVQSSNGPGAMPKHWELQT